MDALPAHAGALVQRIGGAGGAAGLDDDLGALAEIHHAVGALADEQAAVHRQTLLAALTGIDHVVVRHGDGALQRQLTGGVAHHLHPLAAAQHIAACQRSGGHGAAVEADGGGIVGGGAGGKGAVVGGQIVAPEDLGLGGLHEAHAVQLADLTGEQLRGGGVLMGGHPVGVVAQVEGHAGMDDAHILARKGGRVHLLQRRGGTGHQLGGHGAGLVQIIAVLHLGFGAAAADGGGVNDVGALLDLIAGHGVQRQAHVGAVTVGDLQHHVVDGGQIQHVGHGGVVAVLAQLLGDVADGDAAAVGGHALGQRGQRLVEGAELAPLHGFAAAHRQGLGGGELVVHQRGLGVLQQLHAVVGLHLGAEALGAGGLGVAVGKALQIKRIIVHGDTLLYSES